MPNHHPISEAVLAGRFSNRIMDDLEYGTMRITVFENFVQDLNYYRSIILKIKDLIIFP